MSTDPAAEIAARALEDIADGIRGPGIRSLAQVETWIRHRASLIRGGSYPAAGRVSPMEAWSITPTCIANRGHEGAWDEAVARLREIFDVQRKHNPDQTLIVMIGRPMEASDA
jgi:predicted metal-dependent hydrolase